MRALARRESSRDDVPMQTYAEMAGRGADFLVRYRLRDDQGARSHQRVFQHIRSDWEYAEDDRCGVSRWIVWPEFLDAAGAVLPDEAIVEHEGLATMWILRDQTRPYHRTGIRPGVRGVLLVGPHRIADAEVVEVRALRDSPPTGS